MLYILFSTDVFVVNLLIDNVKILDYKLLLKFSNLNIPLDGNSLVYIICNSGS